MDLGLKGKVAIVTGAASGIGRATALSLAEEGVNIVVADINRPKADSVVKEVEALGVKVLAVQADITKTEDVKKMVAATVEKLGRVDILVNNAGRGRLSDLLSLPDDEFKYNLDLMLFGIIHACKEVVPHMKKESWGRIINIASIFGKQPGGLLDYDCIKAALIMFNKDLSNYLAKDGILVNAICPGPIRTPLWEGPGGLGSQLGKMLGKPTEEAITWFAEQNIPLGHFGLPEDIASMVVFLASEKARFITGESINVDGGMGKAAI